MYRTPNYMPLGFATTQNDGTILGTNQPSGYADYPLGDLQTAYDGPSPASTYASSRPPATGRSLSSSTLLGEGDYFSCRLPCPSSSCPSTCLGRLITCSAPVPGTPHTTRSYSKGDIGGRSFVRPFKHWKQFLDLLASGFFRFLISAGLIVALYELIWRYSSFPVLNTSQKRMFNFLVTALSLALGLNLASSLKSVAVKSRWWILSWEKRNLKDVGDPSVGTPYLIADRV
jgi:hypothetical protein